jgi:hypothetical protein
MNDYFAYTSKQTHSMLLPPPVVGWWILPGSTSVQSYKIAIYKKPRWLTRKLMWLLLEFQYERKDNKT